MDEASPLPAQTPPEEESPLLDPLPYAAEPAEVPAATPIPDNPLEPEELFATRSLESSGLLGSPMHRLMGPSVTSATTRDLPETGSRNLPDLTEIVDPANTSHQPPQAPPVAITTPSDEEAKRIEEQVTKADLERLMGEVTLLYKRVEEELASSRYQSAEALGWLNEARTILMARPYHYPLAELRVQQTRVLLRQVAESQTASGKAKSGLVAWSLFWLLLLGGLFATDWILSQSLVSRGLLTPPALSADVLGEPSLAWFFPPWLCMLMGGLGGVIAALYILQHAISRREYDPTSGTSYLLHPITGMAAGLVIYYLLLAGFLAATVSTTLQVDALDLATQIQIARSPLFLLVAFIGGLAQQSVWRVLRRVWDSVAGVEEKTPEVAPVPVESVPVATEPAPVEPAPSDNGSASDPSAYDPSASPEYHPFPKG
ncbi:MAG: tripartite tricarboxylate transporter TctB family protein [Ardenticatenales bacterium]|nr:tripartite tricarboxylate transporter TctB family protein [Ardenticatenales bacterium]